MRGGGESSAEAGVRGTIGGAGDVCVCVRVSGWGAFMCGRGVCLHVKWKHCYINDMICIY